MSELCNSKIPFYSLLISDLFLFCSFILSHPLYLSYFIFFSPYILKLVSFLSPLFITTFLLFFAFLTGFVHENFTLGLAQSRVSHLQTVCSTVLERLQSRKDVENEEFCCLEDLEMYEIVFGSSVMEEGKGYQVEVLEENSGENPRLELESNVVEGLIQEDQSISKCEDFMGDEIKESSVLGSKLDIVNADEMEQKRLENFLKILDEFERMTSSVEEKKVEPPLGTKIDIDFGEHDAVQLVRNGSEAMAGKRNVTTGNCGKEYNSKVKGHFQKLSSADDYTDENGKDEALKVKNSSQTWDSNLGTYGSMRKEKEWKRTLACKLFEERHNSNGGDGMDSLWETYETDSTKLKSKNDKKKKNKTKIEIESEEECGNDEEINGQLCCLQAFKLSAGKMNLGVGRPNLVKISKAIKGFGWLHHVSKHNKKVHNNGDRY